MLVEWKHVFPSPSKQFNKFGKLEIQGSLKWMKEWNKVEEECMKEIEECLLFVEWICSNWKWWNNYHQIILLILDNSLFDLYYKTTKMLIILTCFILKGQLKLKLYLFCLWCNFSWLAVDACQYAFIIWMLYMDAAMFSWISWIGRWKKSCSLFYSCRFMAENELSI